MYHHNSASFLCPALEQLLGCHKYYQLKDRILLQKLLVKFHQHHIFSTTHPTLPRNHSDYQ
jgi:hypothetical protein